MSTISQLSERQESNVGGGRFIEICPQFKAPYYPTGATQVVQNLKPNPANWTTVRFSTNSLEFEENPVYKNGILFFETSIEGVIAKDTAEKLEALLQISRNRWVILFHNRNNQRLVIGSSSIPAKMQIVERRHRKLAKQRNGYIVRFSLVSKHVTPFYTPVNESGVSGMSGIPFVWMNGNPANWMSNGQ